MNKLRFSGYGLKYWAMVLMLCDHTTAFVIRRGIYGAFLTPEGYLDFSTAPAWLRGVSCVCQVLDVLGHAAFPLFVFLLSEGFLHTRSRKRYLMTLLAAALLSEPVYDWAHYGVLWSWRLRCSCCTAGSGGHAGGSISSMYFIRPTSLCWWGSAVFCKKSCDFSGRLKQNGLVPRLDK